MEKIKDNMHIDIGAPRVNNFHRKLSELFIQKYGK